jgi:hypothetical protein
MFYHIMLQLLPNDLIAIILEYTLDKRHDIMLLQYDISTNHIYYKINWEADSLWNLRALTWTRRVYPMYVSHTNPVTMNNRALYDAHKAYTENRLRNNIAL